MDTSAWNHFLEAYPADTGAVQRLDDNYHAEESRRDPARPWPPVMMRDFVRAGEALAIDVDDTTTVGYIADFLAQSPSAVAAVFDQDRRLLGIAVDEDVMALIKRDGIKALDYPILEAVQRQRPTCSITDSPYVVLNMKKAENWERIGVAERGHVVGVVSRRALSEFAGD